MNKLTLLIKTKYFMTKIKTNPAHLKSYVADYASCSSLLLEQLGKYRYLKLQFCLLGQEEPKKIIECMSTCDPANFFYCNTRSQNLTSEEFTRFCNQPEDYAIVMYDYF